MDCWDAYVAGFFDGEGSVVIGRIRANGKSDYHKIVVSIAQRAKHRLVLDKIAEAFGGRVFIRLQETSAHNWAQQAAWLLQDKESIARFLRVMQPHCIVKAEAIRIGLEFVGTFQKAANRRDSLGRIQGHRLTQEEIERREILRLALREANAVGPLRERPSILPPLDIRRRTDLDVEPEADRSSVSRGESRPLSKLTEDDVRAIKADLAAGVTVAELTRRYPVSYMVISGIKRGTRWKHVT